MKSESAVAERGMAAGAEARPDEPGAGEGGARISEPRPSPSSPDSAPPTESTAATETPCPSCLETLHGEFCHRCGEKGSGSRDLSLRHFAGEAAQEFTSVEHSKLFRTLRSLLFRPGFLTAEWVAGRRRPYLKPLNLLLGVLALNLFLLSIHRPATSYSMAYLLSSDDKGVIAQFLDKWAAKRNMSREAMVERISERWRGYGGMPPLQIFNAFLFALLLALVHLFSKRYFVEHLVFSLHFVSFSLLASALMWPAYFVGGLDAKTRDLSLSLFKMALDAVYLFVALRVFYERATFKNLLRSVVLLAGYFAIYLVTYLVTLLAALVVAAKY